MRVTQITSLHIAALLALETQFQLKVHGISNELLLNFRELNIGAAPPRHENPEHVAI